MTATVEIQSPEREALGHLVLSLADNKAALGRRYGEWAVSAPTLESAVAAAAMAQDELGHARATYPLLKQLEVAGRGSQVAGCMPVLAAELPSWPWFVAVNFAVDGMLTAFVRACEQSAFVGLAQRARKILQEERSHGVHARAWARRLARDEVQRDPFAAALGEAWWQAARWAGPPDGQEFAALVSGGYLSDGPDALRGSLRSVIGEALEDTGLPRLALPEPRDWDGWNPEERV
ncbi:MAG TPA: Phenylacetic acid catabolic protein [Thermoleophilaceae bacterium]